MHGYLSLFLLLVASAPAYGVGHQDTTRPALVVDLALERYEVRPSDGVRLDLWITNNSRVPVDKMELVLVGPPPMWLAGDASDCRKALRKTAVDLGSLGSLSTLRQTLAFCAGNEVEERDATIHFFLHYKWKSGEAHETQQIQLRLRLLGSQLPGVPVGFVAMLIPGLLAVMILKLFGFPGVQKLDATEKGVIGVGASLLLAWLLSLVWPPETQGMMSPDRFFVLSVLASVAAGILLVLQKATYHLRERQRAVLLIQPSDDRVTALRKALRSKSSLEPHSIEVTDTSGTTWVGAIQGERFDGAIVLLGWYEIRSTDQSIRAKIASFMKRNRLARALVMARMSEGVEVKLRDGLFRKEGGVHQETGLERKDFPLKPNAPTVLRAKPILNKERPLVLA